MNRPRLRFELAPALFALSIALPACLAAARAANVADAAHDEAIVRAVGLGWTGGLRALDAPLAALFAWLPLGTRAFRACLASSLACGAAGGATFTIARALFATYADSPRLSAFMATIASLTATLCVGFQIEAQAPAGGTIGALLTLVPLALLLRSTPNGEEGQGTGGSIPGTGGSLAAALFASALALSYEPLLGLAALASLLLTRPRLTIALLFPFLLGLAPFLLGLFRLDRAHGLALTTPLFAAALGEHGESPHGVMLALARDEIGALTCALALVGAGLGLAAKRTRGPVSGVVAIAVVGLGAMAFGVSAGDTRYGAPVLAAIAAITTLAALAIFAGVRAVGAARIPFAAASAAMIVVLAATFPVRAADEALLRCDERVRGAAATWNDVAVGPLPIGAVVFVADRRVATRLLAARAAGALRGDLAIVPTFDLDGRLAHRELTREPKLQPFWRDMALLSAPDEWSLSSLAAARPLVMPFEPKWDRTLARHLVPNGLFARFESEPRGTSDRRKALEAFTADRDRLDHAITSPRDPELLAPTATLLRARALGLAASGDRDLIARALDDLRPFSPSDPIAAALVKRVLAARGVIDVKDFAP